MPLARACAFTGAVQWAACAVIGLAGLIAGPAWGDEQAQIDFANGLFSRGFNEEAADEYRAYLSDYPNGTQRLVALYRLGESETARGGYDAALEAFGKVLDQAGGGEYAQRARLRTGAVLIKLGRAEEAASELAVLSGKDVPEAIRAEALYFLGKAQFDAGKTDLAIEAFSTLAHDVPESPFASLGRYQLAFAYLAKDNVERAAVEFSEIANTEGAGDALRMESRFRAAEAYDQLGWFETAVKAYADLAREYPDSEYARRAKYGHAWALYHSGKYDEALVVAQAFIEAFADSPHRPGMMYLLGNCLHQRKRYSEAIEVYRDLRERFPDSHFALRARYREAWALHLMGDSDGARAVVEQFLEDGRETGLEGEATFLLATILYDSEELAQASDLFRKVHEAFPGSEFAADALFRYGECLVRLGRHADAVQAFDTFARTYPGGGRAGEALLRAGDALFATGAYDESVEYYARVASDGPDNLVERALYRLGVAQHNRHDFAKSAAAFERLVQTFPESEHVAEASVRIGDYWLREGGEPLQAISYFEQAHQAQPEGAFAGAALKGLAMARYETKDFDGAAQTFMRVITHFDEVELNEKSYVWVGQHLFDREEWDQAATAFDALLRHVPDYHAPERVLFKIAECFERSGRIDEAIAQFGRVSEVAPRSEAGRMAQFRTARLYEDRGDIKAAMALYEKGAQVGNGDSAARSRFRLGEIYEDKGQFEVAAKHFMRVAILYFHPELSPESLWRAAQCFEKIKDVERARKTYEEVLKDYPDSQQAAKARARLEALAAV